MLNKFFKLIAWTFYRDIKIKGLENLPDSGHAIFTPNHPNSLMDPLLLSCLPSKYRMRFVAKAPLFKIPLFGLLMRRIGAIPVIRKFEADGKVDYQSFFVSCLDTLTSGDSIVIFPEGASLPQSCMSSIKTGAARLFLLAREKGLNVPVIPVGLNYEHGSIFRSSVVIWIAPPLETDDIIEKYREYPRDAVIELTGRVSKALEECVFQSENYLDRELMLYLEKIYNEDKTGDAWSERLNRLKQFEKGLNIIRDSCLDEINRLRHMLSRHRKLAGLLHRLHPSYDNNKSRSLTSFLAALAGVPFAATGCLLAFLPYQSCDLIVKRLIKYDMAKTATFKVVYSIILFPITFIMEAILLNIFLGWIISILFLMVIIPLSYFTLYFMEWLYEEGWGIPVNLRKLRKTFQDRISQLLREQTSRIVDLIDDLASGLNQ